MSTHNICFRSEIRKISKSALSVAMSVEKKKSLIWSYDIMYVFHCSHMHFKILLSKKSVCYSFVIIV